MIKLFVGWEKALETSRKFPKINGCICEQCNAENHLASQKIKTLRKLIASGEAVVVDNPETSTAR